MPDKTRSILETGKGAEEGAKAHEATGMMRWLLTYADMLTLLFALFVILYAISKPQIQRIIEVQKAVKEAFHGQPATLTEVYQMIEKNPNISKEEKQGQVKELVDYLKGHEQSKEVKEFLLANPDLEKQVHPPTTPVASPLRPLEEIQGKINRYVGENHLQGAMETTIDLERGLVIKLLTDGVLFDLGKADLKPQAKEIIKTIVRLVQEEGITNQIRVDGHTDSLPIYGGPFKDNLELSLARAASVWRYMIQLGLPPYQVSASGYGEFRPIAPNKKENGKDNPEGRKRNRRVEITIPPQEKLTTEKEKNGPEGELDKRLKR